MAEHIQFSPQILQRLGEELVTNVDQGILELVRNSYDADATTCRVELEGADELGGTLRVLDDGVGMDEAAIRSGWLVLGRSPKAIRHPTAGGRLPVGDKGLGRLAALRLGTDAVLATRPKNEPGAEYRLSIRWAEFEKVDVVEAVPLQIDKFHSKDAAGTCVEVAGLRTRLGRREVQRLARALLLLADPFDDTHGFHPELIVPSFADLERRVKEAYFDEAELKLTATLDAEGHAAVVVTDWKGKMLFKAEHDQLTKSRSYQAPPAAFELWVFLLDSQSFTSRSASLAEVRQWLDVVGGVHLYHRGLRVHPYGDPGHDWLEMNLARARSPELRPSTNTSIGRVTVSDPGELLLQKTDRTGFVENDAYADLRRFAIDALDWMARERLRTREERRQQTRVTAGRSLERAQRHLKQSVEALPAESRQAIEVAVGRLEKAHQRESVALREEVQLYRTLATVGTTAAVFSHESTQPITQIETMTDRLESRAQQSLGPAFDSTLRRPIALIRSSVRALRSFASLPRRLLQRDKRRAGRIAIHSVISEMADLFQPFLEKSGISTDLQLVEDNDPQIMGSQAAVESIIANLLTNSINAFAAPGARTSSRKLVVRTEISGASLLLRVMDNGPGVRDLDPEEVWLPGRTTVPGGTGLGLTIVRDATTDLGGRSRAIAAGELGGAEFVIEIPLSAIQ